MITYNTAINLKAIAEPCCNIIPAEQLGFKYKGLSLVIVQCMKEGCLGNLT